MGRREITGNYSILSKKSTGISGCSGGHQNLAYKKLWRGNIAAGNFKPEKCLGEILVEQGFEKNEIEIGFLYLFYRLIRSDKLDSFVLNLMSVDMRPHDLDSSESICST